MRDLWMIVLFLVGLIAGAGVGAVYHVVASKSVTQTLDLRDSEIVELKKKFEHEHERAVETKSLAAATVDKLQREYDTLQLELVEQKRLAALQRKQIAEFLQPGEDVEIPLSADEVPEQPVPDPEEFKEGRVPGGKIAYHKLKMAPVEGEFQITGEIENLSKNRIRSVILHIKLFGPGSQLIESLPVSIDGLEPGARSAFTVTGLTNRPDLFDTVKRFKITTALLTEDRSKPAQESGAKPPAARREP